MTADGLTAIARVLISVSDKTGLVPFARFLSERGVEILSTSGTAKALTEAGVPVTEVSAHTGFPEIMDGRVKTLHPAIHGGILAHRADPTHIAALDEHGIAAIDLVAVNLYPFEATVAAGEAFDSCIENIDIGGPALIRAAAKNHECVTVITEPEDYTPVIEDMRANNGAVTAQLRRRLAADAFARTAAYDAAIGTWFSRALGETFPRRFTLAGTRREVLRYGENPHQEAAFYIGQEPRPGVATARQVQGKELSYNNLNDTDAAFELIAEFSGPAVAIIKHANPCGVALAETLNEAYGRALACDPVSAFGGIIAVNRTLDSETASSIGELVAEVVIAPEAEGKSARRPQRQEKPPDSPDRGDARSSPGRNDIEGAGGRLSFADPRFRPLERGRIRNRHQTLAEPGRDRGSRICVYGLQARQIERDCLRQGSGRGGHRRGPNEPRRFGAHRRSKSARCGRGSQTIRAPDGGFSGGLGRLFPVCRWVVGRGQSRRDRGDSTGWIGPRR